ncbi:cupin domain-containing protein [Halobacterium jilantaiense]|uniref:Cupin domain-containing protein n=1 Tax=Halobacterium jilantaiense TaxID=355548 RepID=A0A1I0QGG7_9EURY|nr:cupin domain-containing protein [Halobacterium jilantaiense]SEW26209.1 Cupin domain-containing protein [Halobacterium jilantaiense]
MALDRYPDVDPDEGEVVTEELFVSEDALVKAFALGPGAAVDPHEHADQTNAFHVLSGEVVVVQGDDEEAVTAPGVVVHERGVPHGARNDSDAAAVFTATMAPMG